MDAKDILRVLLKHCVVIDKDRMITGMTTRMAGECAKEVKEVIEDAIVLELCLNQEYGKEAEGVTGKLKKAGYQVRRIVKFKEGDIIGTDCGNWADRIIMSVDNDILDTSLHYECGHRDSFEVCTYDSLIERGFRIKK